MELLVDCFTSIAKLFLPISMIDFQVFNVLLTEASSMTLYNFIWPKEKLESVAK